MNWIEKIKHATELISVNKDLLFENEEKEKKAVELVNANKELLFQNEEKEKRAAELVIAYKELAFQNEEKEKRAEELIIANFELKKAEKQFRLVVESAPNAMVLINHDGFIKLVNVQTEKLFGYNRNELLEQKLEILIPERFRNHHSNHRNQFFDKPQMSSINGDKKLFAVKKNGKEIRVEIGLNPIETAQGSMVLASIIDISERIIHEETLKKHNEELLFQNKEKEERAAELVIANKELVIQHEEKEKRATELIIANKELVIEHEEKEKRAAELVIANKELNFQNQEREKRATELIIANILKEEAEKSKLIIEEKNKSITDSINYAKRIQQAKLPKKEEIYSFLPQCFILFKPKDIVSGDFYFFHKNDESIFIVAADCTGHGVPGAFMSMIGSEKLDDAIAHSSNTSEILKHLNKGIKHSLHQSDSIESTRDGMDIAICSIDIKSNIVKYAGANRPFWLIRNGKTEIEEIKGTKKAIGGLTEDNQHFDSHELVLQQGDTFYISTDGYADQFGGQGGKKIMTKKFKEILVDIQNKPMHEQEKHLDNFVENWRENAEQVDDILIIGIRL